MKETVIAVEQAAKSRIIDFVVLAKAAGNTACEKRKYAKPNGGFLDISFINDDAVARTVAYSIYDHLCRNVSAQAFVSVINHGYRRYFREEADLFNKDYQEFVSAIQNMDRKANTLPMKTTKNLLFKRVLKDIYADNPYECDYWDFRDFPMSADRINPTSTHHLINFASVRDSSNRRVLKIYIKHLLLETSESVSNINYKHQELRKILNCVDRPFLEWGKDEMEQVIGHLQERYSKRSGVGSCLMNLERFSQYLVDHDLVSENVVRPYHDLTLGIRYEFRETNRDTYVISQIFNVLNEVKPAWISLWFLLLFTTGMRKSEASAMRRDCLEAHGDDTYYIKFYNQKMKKDVTNRIPAGLFSMLDAHIKSIPVECAYLFPSTRKKGVPVQAASVCAMLNREFARLGVKNADGTPFIFRAHDLRHWIAKRMYEEDIPVQFIQEQLHHTSPEMTMAYVEFLDKQKASKMMQYVNANGDRLPATRPSTEVDNREYAEYVQKNMRLHILPNGLCARPKALGQCPTANSCLTCSEFRTTTEDLPKHREHLKRLDEFILSAERYGWEESVSDSRVVREHLVRIIEILEKP